MSGTISWNLQTSIKSGQLENLKVLIAEMTEKTHADEPGALAYEMYINEEGSKLHIYEKYEDVSAVMTHLGNFGQNFSERFMTYLTIDSFTVYGDAPEELRGALAPFGTVFFKKAGGFTR